ncbi:MAG: hypothetical protein WKG03_15710, partial [Telluria sp.]
MKLSLAFGVLALAHQLSFAAPGATVARHDILKWSAMDPVQFGCYVENTFGVRDPRFNCSAKPYVASGDPCSAPEAYEEGPAFPPSAAAKIHPDIKS